MTAPRNAEDQPPSTPVIDDSVVESLRKAVASSSKLEFSSRKPQLMFRLVREIGRNAQPPLAQPATLALDPDLRVIVLDRPAPDRFRMTRFTQDGEPDGTVAEFQKGTGEAELLEPVGLAFDANRQFYIPDARAGCVKKFSADGRWLTTFRSAGPNGEPFASPREVDVDDRGHLLIADTNNNRVVMLVPDGELEWELAQFVTDPAASDPDEFYEPRSICAAKDGEVYVADTNQNRVLRFDRNRQVIATIGGDDSFVFPCEVRLSKDGSVLYVADHTNLRVRRFNAHGTVTGTVVLTQSIGEDDSIVGGGDIDVNEDGHVLMINPVRESVVVLDFVG